MTFRLFSSHLKYATAALLGLQFACLPTQKDESSAQPNIILIMADDQGWGDVGFNGHPTLQTPHLNALAQEGARFNRFYAAAPVCSPTRASCLTGRHPYRMGIYSANVGHLPHQENNLAEILKQQGYRTGHFGKWHLGTLTNDEIDANRGGRASEHYAPPWEHGFDVCFSTESKVPTFNPMITPAASAGGTGDRVEGQPYGTFYWTDPGTKASENLHGDNSRIIMDRVIPFVEDCGRRQQPFLAIIWFHTPHLPTLASDEHRQIYAKLSEDEQHYYGSISALDQQVGRLMHSLDKTGAVNNTMIFYCSDNGPEGKVREGRNQGITAGLRGRKRSLYEGGIRVPGIWWWPARITPQAIDFPATTTDYLPTILEALGQKQQDEVLPLDGVSLLHLIEQNSRERGRPIGFRSGNQEAWITDRYKLYQSRGQALEMYDMLGDPGEESNLLADSTSLNDSQREWLTIARQQLSTWKASMPPTER